MQKHEIEKLRDLPIEGVAERLGLRVVRHKTLCPFHHDHHASLSYSVRRNTYRCFVCGANGDAIDLVQRSLHKTFPEACSWLADEHNVILSSTPVTSLSTRTGAGGEAFSPARFERFFERPWLSAYAGRFLFDERRLDERVVRWCRLTSWRDREGVPWLQTPYYDRDGRLVGVQNRNLVKGALPRFRFQSKLSTFIYSITLNTVKKQLTKHSRIIAVNDSYPDLVYDKRNVEQEMIHNERIQALHNAIGQLKYEQRTALVLCTFEDFSYQDIAEVMQCSLTKVESLIFRAKKNLRKILEK